MLAGIIAGAHRHREIRSAAPARIAILPHQFEPALALTAGARRVLVADEVGLGKTIQAGLAIAECVRRRPEARVLVVAPVSLQSQWQAELLDRFGLSLARGDRDGLDAEARVGAFGDNPWAHRSIWIASLDFLKQPHVASGLPHRLWDLIVVDEAHDACGDSARFRAGTILACRARRLVLLTATPHSGDATRFSRLLSFGAVDDPGDRLTVFRRTRHELGEVVSRRVRWRRVAPSPGEAAALDALMAFERRVLQSASRHHSDAASLLLSVLRKRALSTMAAFAISVERRLEWVERRDGSAPAWLQPSLQFDDGLPADAWPGEELAAISSDLGLSPALERTWLRRLRDLAIRATRHERKIAHLVALVERSREPVVVFTEYRDSLEALGRRLGPWRPVASIHGGLTEPDQRRERERFLRGEASVLLATDVASQGLNLQDRARWVVGIELPWNPSRLQQRAGRVDRIGQRRSVHVTWLMTAHVAGERLECLLRERVRRARAAVGDDALEMSVPSERTIRNHLILGTAIETSAEPEQPVIAISRRWVRPAIAAARREMATRALRARWRGPVAMNRAGCCRLARGRRTWRALLIFTSALHDANGDAIESIVAGVMWTPADAGTIDRVPRDVVEDARRRIAAASATRAKRLARQLSREHDCRLVRERVLVASLIRDLGPISAQPGLFDRRALQHAAFVEQTVADVQLDAAAESETIVRHLSLDAASPRLALIVLA